ncbi:BON domain-containing protein [Stutzerimonas nitrititolerans]|uniref:BON domain-containing protein n=1 Tax=Stutzerimonas nitrititolerans TaxID=2482751 RepID=UPI0007185868|nr:BON domain-containing protein [Stutzerimonas nitrititolerans]KRW56313.1 osmY [Pseudomonas sp. TTU2014-066ASC]KRW64054.1 osmY [Pseudomonas sp. TTU2014-096BSC]WAD26156.1 BON domain-containing protein [Pseudomonadaceae bacterium T75]
MKTIQNSLTAAVIATAMTLPMAGVAFAEDTSALATKDTVMLAANDTMDDAGEAASDTWITTKVKSSLLAEDATPGMDIEVETNNGVVSLSGTVATEAEREAAIAKAKQIKGVREVSADGLKAVE